MNSEMGEWSEAPNELLAMALDRLPRIIDNIRFGAVCSSWYQVAKENCDWLDFKDQLPLMMLPDKERTETRNFYSITENKLYDIQFPEFHGKWCCGSSKGWVVTVDDSSNIHLLNPFTRGKIQLPSLDKFPDDQNSTDPEVIRNYRYMTKTILSANPISTPDYVIVTIVTNKMKLSFHKPGNEKWTTLENQWGPYEDVIYYKDKFYAITSINVVVACDFASNDFPKFTVITHPFRERACQRYLVESSGRLLKVLRHHDWDPAFGYDGDGNRFEPVPERPFWTVGFDVFELEEDTRKWIKTESIGDQILFLGCNSSLSLSALDFPQCKGNCIYFTDNYDDAPEWNYDNGVFNLEDKSITPIKSSHWVTEPLWVAPYFS